MTILEKILLGLFTILSIAIVFQMVTKGTTAAEVIIFGILLVLTFGTVYRQNIRRR